MKSCGMSIGVFGVALALLTAPVLAQDGPVKLGVLTDMSSLYADNGGQGSVVGTFIGVLIQGMIQTYINFDGTLSSWWTKIATGVLLFAFIALQPGLVALARRPAARRMGAAAGP